MSLAIGFVTPIRCTVCLRTLTLHKARHKPSAILACVVRVASQPDVQSPPFILARRRAKYFPLDPEYTNLSGGAYGTIPTPVAEAAAEWSKIIEKNPDRFHRVTGPPYLIQARKQIADFINADLDEVVLVNNAPLRTCSSDVGVFLGRVWRLIDFGVAVSTTYVAVNATISYISDLKPFPKKAIVPLNFPTTNDAILAQFRAFLRSPEAQGEMVKICKEEGVWSVVDAAHSIGQEPGIDMKAASPDFWISNLHKWLMCKRSVAVLLHPLPVSGKGQFFSPWTGLRVTHRNQHVIKTSLPTGDCYIPLAERKPRDSNIQAQFGGNNGTINWEPYMTIPDGLSLTLLPLAFRKWLGGEEKDHEYCHDLAMKGGKLLSERWGNAADGS
ncbi:pyridoxal phosphate-dependent transferase [Coprinopsis sp. MPI-PUGE-AT-0042]|nr:pyridoxal phosphate-dependent transferase [Coprinopsis sp. MPI-PUGE-AT-0042]